MAPDTPLTQDEHDPTWPQRALDALRRCEEMFRARRTIHLAIVKPLLIDLIRTHGTAGTLVGWQGTVEEAIIAIEADPREMFVLDPQCDHRNPDGSCAGHPDGD